MPELVKMAAAIENYRIRIDISIHMIVQRWQSVQPFAAMAYKKHKEHVYHVEGWSVIKSSLS